MGVDWGPTIIKRPFAFTELEERWFRAANFQDMNKPADPGVRLKELEQCLARGGLLGKIEVREKVSLRGICPRLGDK